MGNQIVEVYKRQRKTAEDFSESINAKRLVRLKYNLDSISDKRSEFCLNLGSNQK